MTAKPKNPQGIGATPLDHICQWLSEAPKTKLVKEKPLAKNPVREAFHKHFSDKGVGFNMDALTRLLEFVAEFDGCEIVKEKPLPRLYARHDWKEALLARGYFGGIYAHKNVTSDDINSGKYVEVEIVEVDFKEVE